MNKAVREVCFTSFGVWHSGVTRTALWSAEHLTSASLADAKGLARVNAFHEETRLPAAERSTLRDYSKTGWDRGHLSPSADMPNAYAQQESFSLSNMIPQNPENNRGVWAGIEGAVRTLAKQEGEVYTLTGPLFRGSTLQQLNHRVMVPTHVYKIVYNPRRQAAAAYLVANEATTDYSVISVAELEQMAGLDFFPRMPASIKQAKMALPAPALRGGQGSGSSPRPSAGSAKQRLRDLFH